MAGRVREAVSFYAGQGKLVGMLGGEHSITSGAVAAHAERRPGLSVLFFDAQADLRDDYQGWTHSHACAARRALDHASSLTIVGVRSMTGRGGRVRKGTRERALRARCALPGRA